MTHLCLAEQLAVFSGGTTFVTVGFVGDSSSWFTRFVVRDERTLRGRVVELVFPLGLDIDARSFAELSRAFGGASVRWIVGRNRVAPSE
jgi:hypothetical protein